MTKIDVSISQNYTAALDLKFGIYLTVKLFTHIKSYH